MPFCRGLNMLSMGRSIVISPGALYSGTEQSRFQFNPLPGNYPSIKITPDIIAVFLTGCLSVMSYSLFSCFAYRLQHNYKYLHFVKCVVKHFARKYGYFTDWIREHNGIRTTNIMYNCFDIYYTSYVYRLYIGSDVHQKVTWFAEILQPQFEKD